MNQRITETPQPSQRLTRGSGATNGAGVEETEAVLFALAKAVEQRDSVTAGHCERLALMSLALGSAMSLDRADLMILYRGAYLHDIGKVGIPDSILLKPGPLSQEEWVIMRSHPVRGQEICEHLSSIAPVLPLIRHHHERWDGSGYPDGLRADAIPLLARILQISDIYDALTNSRSYKAAYTAKQAIRMIEEETARGWRDPEIVGTFLKLHGKVILKVVAFAHQADRNLSALRTSLMNWDALLKPSDSPVPASLHFS